jgi:restriction system protein
MRRRTSLIDEIWRLSSRLPWSVSVAASITAFMLFHWLGGMSAGRPTTVDELGIFTARAFVFTFFRAMQYVLPPVLLIGALMSWLSRRRDGVLLSDAAADPMRSIQGLSWREFERLIGAHYERAGFKVEVTGGAGADGGVDIVLRRSTEETLVQCKQWRSQNVGVTTVRELYGVMTARGATHGIVVSAGNFTRDALEFAQGRGIELLNGGALAAALREGRETPPEQIPKCTKCGATMIRRVALKGSKAGQSFWGCSNYPRCRFILP